MKRLWKRLLLLACVVVIASCKGSATPIRTLLDDPSRYDNQAVKIAGEVKSAVGVIGYGAYEIDDGTGSIRVVSQTGGAPREGARVGVQGRFRAIYTVGTHSGAVVIEERRFEP